MPIPDGYSSIAFTWNCTGTSRSIVNTWGCSNGALTTAAAINQVWRTQMVNTAARPYSGAVLSSAYTLVSQKCLSRIAGVLTSDEIFTNVVCSGTAVPPPINTAVLVAKLTGLAGRKYRGRVFAPHSIAETSVDAAGNFNAGTTASLQTAYDNALIALTTAGNPAYLLHSDGSTPTQLIGALVTQRLGTIGRRIRG